MSQTLPISALSLSPTNLATAAVAAAERGEQFGPAAFRVQLEAAEQRREETLVDALTETGKQAGEEKPRAGDGRAETAPANTNPTAPTTAEQAAQLKFERQKQVLEDFEAVFVSMMIKEMRSSAKDLFAGDPSDSLGALFDQHIGSAVAKGGGIGIAEQLTSYLEAQRSYGN